MKMPSACGCQPATSQDTWWVQPGHIDSSMWLASGLTHRSVNILGRQEAGNNWVLHKVIDYGCILWLLTLLTNLSATLHVYSHVFCPKAQSASPCEQGIIAQSLLVPHLKVRGGCKEVSVDGLDLMLHFIHCGIVQAHVQAFPTGVHSSHVLALPPSHGNNIVSAAAKPVHQYLAWLVPSHAHCIPQYVHARQCPDLDAWFKRARLARVDQAGTIIRAE